MLVEKQKVLPQEFAFAEEDIEGIAAPTLLIYGDSDIVRPEHAVELFRLLGGGVPGGLTGDPLPSSQLAFLPGADHATIVLEPTDLLLAMIEAFLAAPLPEAA